MALYPDDWRNVDEAISKATGEAFHTESAAAVGGGSINDAFRIEGAGRAFFVKRNRPGLRAMFDSEARSLGRIVATGTLRAPAPVCVGENAAHCFLVLEHLRLGAGSPAAEDELGAGLAAMHRHTGASFGWDEDNTIGSTPQLNTPCANWVDFFAQRRLGYQLELALERGAPARLLDAGKRVQQELGQFFRGYSPQPSLLHGDLWGGNWGCDEGGRPVIFDPACYYGDREADLAMTELFGGFGDRFYQSYVNAWAIDPGYNTRKVLYNLYHVLNHFNLFGGGYAAQAGNMADRLIAELS